MTSSRWLSWSQGYTRLSKEIPTHNYFFICLQKKGMSSNYLETVENHPELKSLREALISRVEVVMEKANAKKDSYLDYAYLWTDSRCVCHINLSFHNMHNTLLHH